MKHFLCSSLFIIMSTLQLFALSLPDSTNNTTLIFTNNGKIVKAETIVEGEVNLYRYTYQEEGSFSVPLGVTGTLKMTGEPVKYCVRKVLSVGKKADIVIFSDNLYELPVEEIPNASAVLTMMDGVFRHREGI